MHTFFFLFNKYRGILYFDYWRNFQLTSFVFDDQIKKTELIIFAEIFFFLFAYD
jgi:hypothetical protein